MNKLIFSNPNSILRCIISAEKHAWGKIVKDASNWDEVAKIMTKVMKKGVREPYKIDEYKKVLKIGDEVVEVIFRPNIGQNKIGDAWVKTI